MDSEHQSIRSLIASHYGIEINVDIEEHVFNTQKKIGRHGADGEIYYDTLQRHYKKMKAYAMTAGYSYFVYVEYPGDLLGDEDLLTLIKDELHNGISALKLIEPSKPLAGHYLFDAEL